MPNAEAHYQVYAYFLLMNFISHLLCL